MYAVVRWAKVRCTLGARCIAARVIRVASNNRGIAIIVQDPREAHAAAIYKQRYLCRSARANLQHSTNAMIAVMPPNLRGGGVHLGLG